MDVLRRAFQLPLSAVRDIDPHARAVAARCTRALPLSAAASLDETGSERLRVRQVFLASRANAALTAHSNFAYRTKVAPCGMATGLDIGLSNLSLRTITLSFYSQFRLSR